MVQNQIELQKTNVNAINTFLKLDVLQMISTYCIWHIVQLI